MSKTFACSVVVCTHNPHLPRLQRVVRGLQGQDLPRASWELCVVDNCSNPPVSSTLDWSWHPNIVHLIEPDLGLTRARSRGISESTGSLLVFVDDDNVLATDYVSRACAIAQDYPFIGAFSGSCLGEFESEPAPEVLPFLTMLAVRQVDKDYWSNFEEHSLSRPCGAGLCVRREVAQKYVSELSNNPLKLALDRKGAALTSGGDDDLALTSLGLGLGTGVFSLLKLTHLIPSQRLRPEYLIRLAEGLGYSSILLEFVRGHSPPTLGRSALFRLAIREQLGRLCGKILPLRFRIETSYSLGQKRARALLLDGGLALEDWSQGPVRPE